MTGPGGEDGAPSRSKDEVMICAGNLAKRDWASAAMRYENCHGRLGWHRTELAIRQQNRHR